MRYQVVVALAVLAIGVLSFTAAFGAVNCTAKCARYAKDKHFRLQVDTNFTFYKTRHQHEFQTGCCGDGTDATCNGLHLNTNTYLVDTIDVWSPSSLQCNVNRACPGHLPHPAEAGAMDIGDADWNYTACTDQTSSQ